MTQLLAFARSWLLMAVVWLCLAPFRLDFLLVGLAATGLAAALLRALNLGSGPLVRPVAVLAYAPGALWRSALGGLDVSRRVLGPRLRIAPGFFREEAPQRAGPWGAVFGGIVSLMPGSMAVGQDTKRRLWIHLLADDAKAREAVEAERRKVDRVLNGPAKPVGHGAGGGAA